MASFNDWHTGTAPLFWGVCSCRSYVIEGSLPTSLDFLPVQFALLHKTYGNITRGLYFVAHNAHMMRHNNLSTIEPSRVSSHAVVHWQSNIWCSFSSHKWSLISVFKWILSIEMIFLIVFEYSILSNFWIENRMKMHCSKWRMGVWGTIMLNYWNR